MIRHRSPWLCIALSHLAAAAGSGMHDRIVFNIQICILYNLCFSALIRREAWYQKKYGGRNLLIERGHPGEILLTLQLLNTADISRSEAWKPSSMYQDCVFQIWLKVLHKCCMALDTCRSHGLCECDTLKLLPGSFL